MDNRTQGAASGKAKSTGGKWRKTLHLLFARSSWSCSPSRFTQRRLMPKLEISAQGVNKPFFFYHSRRNSAAKFPWASMITGARSGRAMLIQHHTRSGQRASLGTYQSQPCQLLLGYPSKLRFGRYVLCCMDKRHTSLTCIDTFFRAIVKSK